MGVTGSGPLDARRVLYYGIEYDLVVVEERSRLVLGIACQTCRRVSFHPTDVQERYCGACHVLHDERTKAGPA